jgi:hypothetical protein
MPKVFSGTFTGAAPGNEGTAADRKDFYATIESVAAVQNQRPALDVELRHSRQTDSHNNARSVVRANLFEQRRRDKLNQTALRIGN